MENEIWKVIDGYNGTCEVSSYGRFRRRTHNRYSYIKPLRNWKQIRVKFKYEGKNIYIKNFDRLVAETFIDNVNNSEYVEHLDGDIENNHIDNLVWSELSYEEAKRKNLSQGKRKPNEYYITENVVHVKLKHSDKEMLCDIQDWEELKETTWFYDCGYVKAKYKGSTTRVQRVIMNPPKGMEVDHINHNPLDNRRKNLRVVSHMVNMANRGRQSNNKTGMNGVSYSKNSDRYYAQINVNGKRIYLGCYKTIEEAKDARRRAEREYKDPFIEQGTLR